MVPKRKGGFVSLWVSINHTVGERRGVVSINHEVSKRKGDYAYLWASLIQKVGNRGEVAICFHGSASTTRW